MPLLIKTIILSFFWSHVPSIVEGELLVQIPLSLPVLGFDREFRSVV